MEHPWAIRGENDGDNDFRISVAAVQAKTALLHRDGRWWRPSGATPTTHLLKPQIGRWSRDMHLRNSVENEYLCLKLLEAFELPVAQVEMVTFGTQKVLVVERFDRRRTRDNRIIRLHQEDVCQALACPPSRKSQSDGGPGIVAVVDRLRGSDEAVKDRTAFFKANVLFWLMGASDGHGKNFSLALLPGGRFQVFPVGLLRRSLTTSIAMGIVPSKQWSQVFQTTSRLRWLSPSPRPSGIGCNGLGAHLRLEHPQVTNSASPEVSLFKRSVHLVSLATSGAVMDVVATATRPGPWPRSRFPQLDLWECG